LFYGLSHRQHTTGVCWGGGLNKYQGCAADRFQRRLSASVDMTSDVRSCQQLFYVCRLCFPRPWKSRSQENTTGDPADSRGLTPTFLSPSGPASIEGRASLGPHHAAEGDTTPGLRLFQWTLATCCTGASRTLQRAWREGSRHLRGNGPHARDQCTGNGPHDLLGIFASGEAWPGACAPSHWRLPRMSWMGWGSFSSRRWRWRLPLAGDREAQAPSTSARRACVFPAWVRVPWRRRAPLEDAEGVKPRERISCLGLAKRSRSPGRPRG